MLPKPRHTVGIAPARPAGQMILELTRHIGATPSEPEQAVPPERLPDTNGLENLARACGERRSDEHEMRLDSRVVPRRVLDHHNQPHGASMLVGESLALLIGAAVLGLEVRCHSLDLYAEDLPRPEEADVDRLTLLTGSDLELRMPRVMRLPSELLHEPKLPRVSQRRLSPRVCPEDEVETDDLRHGADRLDTQPAVAQFDTDLS